MHWCPDPFQAVQNKNNPDNLFISNIWITYFPTGESRADFVTISQFERILDNCTRNPAIKQSNWVKLIVVPQQIARVNQWQKACLDSFILCL